MPVPANLYRPHRFPGEIISHAVWLSFCFPLRHRDVEEPLFVRGVLVSYQAIRQWCWKSGQQFANQLRRRQARPGDKWHMDEVFLTINTKRHYLGRAVDQDSRVLEILGQRRRNKQATKTFFRTLLKDCLSVPRVIITEKLKHDGAAKREMLPGVAPHQRRYRNTRCANAQRPTRQGEQRMPACHAPGHAQRFRSVYGPIAHHCRPRRHRVSASTSRQAMRNRVASWAESTGAERAASRVRGIGEEPPRA
jgi:putative transposase